MLFPDVEVDTVEDLVATLPGTTQLVTVKVSHVGTLQGKCDRERWRHREKGEGRAGHSRAGQN